MRGKGLFQNGLEQHQRITPAYAGKSVPVDPRRHLSGDHPRLCGEKQIQPDLCPSQGGITPAYAGKSRC